MLIFALGLLAAAVLVSGSVLLFLFENLLALLCAGLAGHLALKTGGGWPGALLAGAAAFTALSLALRLGATLARPLGLRLTCISLIIIPSAAGGLLLSCAVLAPFVPAPAWRVALSVLAAAFVTPLIAKRQLLSSGSGASPNP